LRPWRPLAQLGLPATLDGGDVLRIGRTLYVGLGARSNAEGALEHRRLLTPFGYRIETIAVRGCLHLKSAVTAIDDALLLAVRTLGPACPRRAKRIGRVFSCAPNREHVV
jgi:dimethylargininase